MGKFSRTDFVLNQQSDVPIVRHIEVKGNKTPYGGDWTYGNARIGKYPGVRNNIVKLLKRQKNNCAHCGLNFRPTV